MPTAPEPTRPLTNVRQESDGSLRATAILSPKACNTRASIAVPPNKVIPVIFIPGIMGSNLCATRDTKKHPNTLLKSGEAAWRPPNGAEEGLKEASLWKRRDPSIRQAVLDAETLDVDGSGAISLPRSARTGELLLSEEEARKRGWGEVHASSYATVLCTLQLRLNATFRDVWGHVSHDGHWTALNKYGREHWGGTKEGVLEEVSECELQKFAEYHYPVYAFGYNWLESNERSGDRLRQRIEDIIGSWTKAKHKCSSVILVTHSMGGLVARACAKAIPEKIAGVIHGAMPALGAPVCYRRIAYGTESSHPGKSAIENIAAGKFADIAGRRPEDTTAVMATASGALELLPNHLYPGRWLFAAIKSNDNSPAVDYLRLPAGSPYELYRDLSSWYRVINPALADPANKYKGNVEAQVRKAIRQAERFHTEVLGSYYHPNTFAFYGDDAQQQSVGTCRWLALSDNTSITEAVLESGKPYSHATSGARNVGLPAGQNLFFLLTEQHVAGDGTVPGTSGAGPAGKVLRLLRTTGYDHQGSYNDPNMLHLTQHLIAKMVQKL
jgi:pimeloyl-ACP methyl ester carboxylesterase